jgi:hypothetical protein
MDEQLKHRALEVLGPLGDELAREALALSDVEVTPGVHSWEGSHGRVRADRVLLVMPQETYDRLKPAIRHALEVAFAVAVAQEPLTSLYELVIEAGVPQGSGGGPYR